ncbi:sensor histidine kinase [Actinophytocola gossypii]|uniref:histidine kinase n=1 Tax=Actinophytocola gossypii TaxID=2812003 RepID=A0ABT2JFY7_9PSEU|nr:histidine kinase [Actinophytocola gossypii]MCT2586668.1 two-component sensor histidine kinase [Actinophytocola gossypii]
MTPMPVPHRWLAAILGVAFVLDAFIAIESYGGARNVLVLPGSALIALCAFLALTRPVVGALLGVLTLLLSSALIASAELYIRSIGLTNITLTEMVAGTVLTVFVVWRGTPVAATACTAALVVGCLAAVVVRGLRSCHVYFCDPGLTLGARDLAVTGMLGFFLLGAAIAVGVYLRRAGGQRVETEMNTLVRKQWPLAVALAVVALFELPPSGSDGLPGVFSGVIAGVCAFFAPRNPQRNALIAAGVIAGLPLITGLSATSDQPMTLTNLAASMALVAYVVRQASRRDAVWSTLALVVANGFALGIRSPMFVTNSSSVLLLLFLLGVAIVTGWYFRARDRERNQTVRAAVNSAQQGERMALARELHDVVAHHVTGIVVQAQAALLVAAKNPGVAVTALEKIEYSGTEALTAMRTLVGSLRDGTAATADPAATGQATTDLRADLAALVDNYAGPPIALDLDLPEELPHEVGRSVLRLVQESLTNVGKHAPDATEVRVRVARLGETLHIRVVDDGARRPVKPAGGSGGYGLVGMRERVELLGGRFEAGPSGYVGWSVEAWLPVRGKDAT